MFPVLVVPQLGGDPKLVAAQPILKKLPEGLADLMFIAIHRGAIEMPIARLSAAALRPPAAICDRQLRGPNRRCPNPIAGIVAPL